MIETLASLYKQAGYEFPPIPRLSLRDVMGNLGNFADARIGSAIYNLLQSGASTYTGRPVSPATAMTYSAVYGCVSKIAKSVASCPLITHRNTGRNSDTKNPATDDYRYRMLKEQPNEEMTSFQWREAIVTHLLLWGNHYSWLDWDGAGRLRAIWPLEPAYVQVLRTRLGGHLVYRYFPHNPYSVPVEPGVYAAQDILHIPYLGFDGTVGFSPITLMRQAVSLGMAAEEYLGRFFANGGKPPYWIEFEGQIKDEEEFKTRYHRVQASLDKAGSPALMYGGLKLHELKMSPEDAQFIEGRNFQVSEICRLYDMPPYMMGDPNGKAATYASAEQGDIYYAKHTVAPVCERLEKKIDLTILGSNDALTCSHDLRALYRADMKTIAQAHAQEIFCGKITPNEARTESGMNPGPADLDKHWMQGGMATVERLANGGPTTQQPARGPFENENKEQ